MSSGPASSTTGQVVPDPPATAVSRADARPGRARGRAIECLRCGTPRRVGAIEGARQGECPACGYLGWKPGHRLLALVPRHAR